MVAEISVSQQIRGFPKIKDIFANVVWSKRICIDIDGVICEYDFPKIVKNFLGVDLSSKMIFAYDLADVLGVAPSLIDAMFQNQVFGKPNFITGAIATLEEWEAKGYDLAIFSNRIKYMGYGKLEGWLTEWQIPYSRIDEGKGEYEFHIDDSPGKLMTTKSAVKLLYNQPWNERCLNIQGGLKRVYNWAEIKAKVSQLP